MPPVVGAELKWEMGLKRIYRTRVWWMTLRFGDPITTRALLLFLIYFVHFICPL
jgi:hypothetical protein